MNVKHNGNTTTHWPEKEKNLNGLMVRRYPSGRRYSRAKIREGSEFIRLVELTEILMENKQ